MGDVLIRASAFGVSRRFGFGALRRRLTDRLTLVVARWRCFAICLGFRLGIVSAHTGALEGARTIVGSSDLSPSRPYRRGRPTRWPPPRLSRNVTSDLGSIAEREGAS